jgi:hypothetical protein
MLFPVVVGKLIWTRQSHRLAIAEPDELFAE